MTKPIATARNLGGSWLLTPGGRWKLPRDDEHFKFKTFGPWQIITQLRGLAVVSNNKVAKIYGYRNLLRPRESGHEMEGHVSIGGRRYSAFTGSMLFVEDPHTSQKKSRSRLGKRAKDTWGWDARGFTPGRLVDVAVLHVRMR